MVEHHDENEDNQDEMIMRSRITCSACEFKTTSDYVLKRHTEVHHKGINNTITCAVCKEKFHSNNDLNKHMNAQHTEATVSRTQSGKPSSRIVCDLCGQRFNKRTTFNTHVEKKHRSGYNKNFNLIRIRNDEVPDRSSGKKKEESASVSTSDQDH